MKPESFWPDGKGSCGELYRCRTSRGAARRGWNCRSQSAAPTTSPAHNANAIQTDTCRHLFVVFWFLKHRCTASSSCQDFEKQAGLTGTTRLPRYSSSAGHSPPTYHSSFIFTVDEACDSKRRSQAFGSRNWKSDGETWALGSSSSSDEDSSELDCARSTRRMSCRQLAAVTTLGQP